MAYTHFINNVTLSFFVQKPDFDFDRSINGWLWPHHSAWNVKLVKRARSIFYLEYFETVSTTKSGKKKNVSCTWLRKQLLTVLNATVTCRITFANWIFIEIVALSEIWQRTLPLNRANFLLPFARTNSSIEFEGVQKPWSVDRSFGVVYSLQRNWIARQQSNNTNTFYG